MPRAWKREIDEVKHIGREAETIAELLEEHAEVDDEQRRRNGGGQIDIDDVRQRDAEHHGPQPALQTMARDTPAAEQAADGESYDAHGAIDEAHRLGGERQAARLSRVEKEGIGYLHQLTFGEAEKQHEEQGRNDMRLREEGLQGKPEFGEER